MRVTSSGNSIMLGLILTLFAGSAFAQASPAAHPRYVIKGDTVYDKQANLSWQRCSLGQRWVDGTGCVGTVERFDFRTAQQQASGTWRIPTKDELPTLVVIRADQDTPFKYLFRAIKTCQDNGFRNFAMKAMNKSKEAAGGKG